MVARAIVDGRDVVICALVDGSCRPVVVVDGGAVVVRDGGCGSSRWQGCCSLCTCRCGAVVVRALVEGGACGSLCTSRWWGCGNLCTYRWWGCGNLCTSRW